LLQDLDEWNFELAQRVLRSVEPKHEPAGSTWAGRRGMIVDHLADLLGESLAVQQAYLCGPPGMIDSCVSGLKAGGVPESAIHFDKFLDQSHLASTKKVA
jgi:NAD(P)H-flavin reductase